MADVLLTMAAARQLDRLTLTPHARVLAGLDRLARWPDVRGVHALQPPLSGLWRIRAGEWRLQFEVESGRAIVVWIGRGGDKYD